ncbi:hypothetical protein PDE_03519 [Penicillium oxalicum 114-2]|uniref:Rhodopsin domain-containing protein n=1 Tax=Penicillium oxalicum (strain 114-2 / CGMCC 5302) TaxID=933388 RepID=S8ARD5_PENO1|nr:hypothetical protein PDE_03519 [Penicillium oxalicum 114-2]
MEYPARYTISATDRSGLIVIVETLFMSWMIMVTLIRLYMRLAINGPVQVDDLVVFAGAVFAIAHVGTVMNAISHGLGRTLDGALPSDLSQAANEYYVANLLFLAGHGAAKISVSLLLTRLGRQKLYMTCAKVLLGTVVAWCIASIFAISFTCLPRYQWSMAQQCSNVDTAWKTISAFDILTDVLSFGLSIFLVWGIQMRWKEKATVIFAFGTRLPSIILIILRQTYLDRSMFSSNPTLHLSDAQVMTAVLLHYSIMVATVPCLKPFVISFNTGWGQGLANSNGEHPYYTPSGKSTSGNHSRAYTQNRGDETGTHVSVARLSSDSHNSQQMIIRETREWIVEEEYEMHSVDQRNLDQQSVVTPAFAK